MAGFHFVLTQFLTENRFTLFLELLLVGQPITAARRLGSDLFACRMEQLGNRRVRVSWGCVLKLQRNSAYLSGVTCFWG
jgi:hypothetical protein